MLEQEKNEINLLDIKDGNMEYNKTYDAYMDYVDRCRYLIKNTFFTRDELGLLPSGKDDNEINQIIREHRLKMIDIKFDHTMRMIEQVIKINDKLGIEIDLKTIIKVAVLYHDIGRIRQSTWANMFEDSIYEKKKQPFKNHAEDGYNIFIYNDFDVERKYVPIISQTILNHQNYSANPKLTYRFADGLGNINIDDMITGKFQLNDTEWQIASLIVQLVSDVDKTDVLYQHLSSDFEMIKDYVFDSSKVSLDDIAKKWGVPKSEILEFNKLDEQTYMKQPKKVKVPVENMEDEKIMVPEYMKQVFYDNSWPELQFLIHDSHWNFVSMLWWRLSHFLNQISFTSVLVNLEESRLLEQIYDKIPDRFKPLVFEAFEYAKCELVNRRIEENKGNIYLR